MSGVAGRSRFRLRAAEKTKKLTQRRRERRDSLRGKNLNTEDSVARTPRTRGRFFPETSARIVALPDFHSDLHSQRGPGEATSRLLVTAISLRTDFLLRIRRAACALPRTRSICGQARAKIARSIREGVGASGADRAARNACAL